MLKSNETVKFHDVFMTIPESPHVKLAVIPFEEFELTFLKESQIASMRELGTMSSQFPDLFKNVQACYFQEKNFLKLMIFDGILKKTTSNTKKIRNKSICLRKN